MDDVLRETLVQPRFLAMLARRFAAIALVLAAIGIYGAGVAINRLRLRSVGR